MQYGPDIMNCCGMMSSCKHSNNLKSFYPQKNSNKGDDEQMDSPYKAGFTVTQEYKGEAHDGLDLCGIGSKDIYSTVSGTVRYAGWEDDSDHSKGFGLYVCIHAEDGRYYYFGHLSVIKVSTGQRVRKGELIGVEGSTGNSTGSHCHYCCRKYFSRGNAYDISGISGIPNIKGYTSVNEPHRWDYEYSSDILALQRILNSKGADLDEDGIAGEKTLEACKRYTIRYGDSGSLVKWVQGRLGCANDGVAGPETMDAIARFQCEHGLGIGYLGGEDWYYLIR